jgi:hypothetical protein
MFLELVVCFEEHSALLALELLGLQSIRFAAEWFLATS